MITLTLYFPDGYPGRGRKETCRTVPGLVPGIGENITTTYGTFRVKQLWWAASDGEIDTDIAVDLIETED